MEAHRLQAIVLYLTAVSSCGAALVGRLQGSVELPCLYPRLPGPIHSISVTWQRDSRQGPLVVAAVVDGEVQPKYQHPMFRGRALLRPERFPEGSFNLTLHNLSLSDSGSYNCIIMWSPNTTRRVHSSTEELEVTAAFSPPVLAAPSARQPLLGEEVTLTCSSQGGLEPPRILWTDGSDGSEVQGGRVHVSVQPHLGVINVTSTITLNITSSISIMCTLVTERGNWTSERYTMEITEIEPGPSVLLVSILVGGAVGVILIIVLVRWRHMRRAPTYAATAIQMSELGSG